MKTPLSEFSCPDCGGVLRERSEKGLLRFRCRVGHQHTAESLSDAQDVTLEAALQALAAPAAR